MDITDIRERVWDKEIPGGNDMVYAHKEHLPLRDTAQPDGYAVFLSWGLCSRIIGSIRTGIST